MTQAITAWQAELVNDYDADYLLSGIKEGFLITDEDANPVRSCTRNYKSATVTNREATEAAIVNEVNLGRYIICKDKPFITSSLGAIPKNNNSIRIIHDLSRPKGGVNQWSTNNSVAYATIDDALKLTKQSSYLAKVDLKNAYRLVPIHPKCYRLTGFQWKFTGDSHTTSLFDAWLPFGASKACRILGQFPMPWQEL